MYNKRHDIMQMQKPIVNLNSYQLIYLDIKLVLYVFFLEYFKLLDQNFMINGLFY